MHVNSSEVEENGGFVLLVEKKLEEAAKSPAWKEYMNSKKQLRLF